MDLHVGFDWATLPLRQAELKSRMATVEEKRRRDQRTWQRINAQRSPTERREIGSRNQIWARKRAVLPWPEPCLPCRKSHLRCRHNGRDLVPIPRPYQPLGKWKGKTGS